jgi:hypothetical protein
MPGHINGHIHVAWAKGGGASFLSAEGENVTLRSTSPSPPGSRLDATFADEPSAVVRIKVHGSKKEDDGSFTIRGRLVDATREIRERVHRLAVRAE